MTITKNGEHQANCSRKGKDNESRGRRHQQVLASASRTEQTTSTRTKLVHQNALSIKFKTYNICIFVINIVIT